MTSKRIVFPKTSSELLTACGDPVGWTPADVKLILTDARFQAGQFMDIPDGEFFFSSGGTATMATPNTITPVISLVDVKDAALELYLRDGRDHTVKELAGHLEVSEAKVRRLLNDDHGAMLHVRKELRTSYSHDYPGFEMGQHVVLVYGPSREWLRDLVIAAKQRG